MGRSRSWVERYTHEILQKRHQNPGAISRYFNAQKAGPSLDSLAGKEDRVYPPLAKGPLIKTVTRPVRHLVSARILGLTARSKNNTDVNPIRGRTASRIENSKLDPPLESACIDFQSENGQNFNDPGLRIKLL